MAFPSLAPEDRLLPLLERLRRLAADAPPLTSARLSPSQMALLCAIAETPGSGVQEVAVALGLATPTVSIAVSRLESAGLLERHPNPHDRRAVRIHLTTRGDAVYREALAARRRRAAEILAALPPDDRLRLVDLLERALGAAADPAAQAEPGIRPRGVASLLRRARGLWRGLYRA